MMNHECCLSNCGHTYQNNDCIFIPFPSDTPTLTLWRSHLGTFEAPNHDSRVCNCHFDSLTADYCYETPLESLHLEVQPDLELDYENGEPEICIICMGTENLMEFPETEYKNYVNLLRIAEDTELQKTVCYPCLDDLQNTLSFLEKCKRSFAMLTANKKHVVKEETDSEGQERTKKSEFACKHCSQRFDDYGTFLRHETTHKGFKKRGRPRKEAAESQEDESRKQGTQCEKCGGYFQKLWVHITNSKACQSEEQSQHSCNQCDQIFHTKTSLMEHSRLYHKKNRGRPRIRDVKVESDQTDGINGETSMEKSTEPVQLKRGRGRPRKSEGGKTKKIKQENYSSNSDTDISDDSQDGSKLPNPIRHLRQLKKEEDMEKHEEISRENSKLDVTSSTELCPEAVPFPENRHISTTDKNNESPVERSFSSSSDEDYFPTRNHTKNKAKSAKTRNSSEVEEFLCHLCSRLFKRHSTLTMHLKNHEKRSEQGLSRRPGRPTAITKERLEFCMKNNFSAKQMAQYFACSIQCIYRHCIANGMRMLTSRYTPIDDEDLRREIELLHEQFPTSGAEMMNGHLQAKGVYVQRRRVRTLLAEIDPTGTVQRRTHLKKHDVDKEACSNATNTPKIRHSYAVPAPNSLWHLDANLKLARWGFVIHGCIDGFSRVILYLKCGTLRSAAAVLPHFVKAVQLNGLPRQVQSIFGYENVLMELLQSGIRHAKPGAEINEKSVQVQRIKKLWIDIYKQTIDAFQKEFYALEQSGDLDPYNNVHRYALHRLYQSRINAKLDLFSSGWNSHKVSKAGAKTPYQCYQENLGNEPDEAAVALKLSEVFDTKQLDFDVLILPENVGTEQIRLDIEQDGQVSRIAEAGDKDAKVKFVELVQYLRTIVNK